MGLLGKLQHPLHCDGPPGETAAPATLRWASWGNCSTRYIVTAAMGLLGKLQHPLHRDGRHICPGQRTVALCHHPPVYRATKTVMETWACLDPPS
ncbi:hypothetical protein ACOMHN_058747 [Nucella lapillus]